MKRSNQKAIKVQGGNSKKIANSDLTGEGGGRGKAIWKISRFDQVLGKEGFPNAICSIF